MAEGAAAAIKLYATAGDTANLAEVMKQAGAAVPSANRISLLRNKDGDGVAETHSALLPGLYSPFGTVLIGADHYVANTDAVLRFPYAEAADAISAAGVKVADLPGGPLNHHWTKGLTASQDGKRLYASIGSNSRSWLPKCLP